LEEREEIFINVLVQKIPILKGKDFVGSQGRLSSTWTEKRKSADCAGILAKGPWIKNRLGLQR
jgi:hypothetical protein